MFFLSLFYTFTIYDGQKINEQRAKSNHQRAKCNEQRGKSNKQTVMSNKQILISKKEKFHDTTHCSMVK